jgi:hypothetical protein
MQCVSLCIKCCSYFLEIVVFSHAEWVKPVPGDVYKAMCSWCNVVLPANLRLLKQHAKDGTHMKIGSCEVTGYVVDFSVFLILLLQNVVYMTRTQINCRLSQVCHC